MNHLLKVTGKRSITDLLRYESFILFGASEASREVIRFLELRNKTIEALSDNNPKLHGSSQHGYPVIAPEAIKTYGSRSAAIIISSSYQYEIALQLINQVGISKERVYPYITAMFAPQFNSEYLLANCDALEECIAHLADDESRRYFRDILSFRLTMDPLLLKRNPKLTGYYHYDDPLIGPFENDAILDCGAYNGDTAEEFSGRLKRNCTIYALEAYPPNYRKLVDYVKAHDLDSIVKPMNIAVGNKKDVLKFEPDSGDSNPRATLRNKERHPAQPVEIAVECIDNLFQNRPVDFIKMDIEGMEKEALAGAAQVIRANKPGLAIAGYHQPEDLWKIPGLIRSLCPEYNIFAGHHPKCIYEIEFYFGLKGRSRNVQYQ